MQADSDFGFLDRDRRPDRDTTGGSTSPTLVVAAPTDGEAVGVPRLRGRPDAGLVLGPGQRAASRHGRPSRAGGRRPSSRSAQDRGATSTGSAGHWSSRSSRASEPADREQDDQHRGHAAVIRPRPRTLADRLVDRWTAGAVTAQGHACPVEPADRARGRRHRRRRRTGVRHLPRHRGRARLQPPAASKPVSPQAIVAPPAWSTCCPASRSSSFRRDGLVIGIVTTVGNPQGSAGDVKVKYTSLGDQVESNWARVVTLGAGCSRGMTFLPEINDEVIVGFEGGDARRPVVLGGVYNGQDVPVEFGVANSTVSKRRITSRLGHFVEFGDGTDAGQPAHRAQPGRRAAPGAAGQGQARRRRCRRARRSRSRPAMPRSRSARTGRSPSAARRSP